MHIAPAAALHLTYGDGNQVANNETTISAFNRFLAEQRRPPKSAKELKAWFSNGILNWSYQPERI